MPAPRAARLAQRKSVVPDPNLYGDPTDSDDSDAHQQRASKPPAAKSSSSSARGRKGPPPLRGSVTADNGRRRSTRLSNESAEGVAAATSKPSQGSSRGGKTAEAAAPARGKQAASKGKKRAARDRDSASEEDEDEEDKVVRVDAGGKASKARAGAKRSKVDRDEVDDEEEAAASAPVASSSQAAAAAPRRGFVPRAAANLSTRPNKPPPEYSTVLVDSSADDPEPFLFSTHPPTPHASGQAKRAAAKPKQNPRAKVPRTARAPTESDEITPDDRLPPIPSTSRSRLTPPRHPSDSAPLHAHETPVQVKNIAFRQGAGPGTPATGGRSVRRSSARGSKNRGSSIGGGFEAVPHPQVADDKLYRSTDADDPLAKRLRSIVSWSAQRTRDRIYRSLPPEGERDAAQRMAREVMDEFVADVCSLRVDTSVPFEEPSQSQDPDQLPPHPQNVSNAAKMKELEENYAAIAHEQELRESLEPVYQSFFDRRSTAHSTASTSYPSLLPPTLSSTSAPTPTPEALAKYASTLDLSRPAPRTLDDALELGRALLAGQGVKEQKPSASSAKKGKGRASLAASAVAEEGEAEGVDRRILEAQIETAQFRHLTHRLSSFSRLAQSYIAHRSSETHRALAAQASHGLGVGGREGAVGEDEAEQAGMAGALGGVGVGAGGAGGERDGALETRDLLRAISRADVPGR
ncbi:hypothetical protein JCM6882_008199 [Rhodosporidiobolus microsporus]